MRYFLPIVLFVSVFIHNVSAAERVALIIGNSAYEHVTPLTNPVNDAALMEAALKTAGFAVIRQDNLNQQGMKKALLEFGRRLKNGAEASMFYYAGHGIEINGVNYLVPVDADLQNKEEADLQGIKVNDFMSLMENSGVPLNIVVLDACRNNPFRSMRGSAGGLAPVLAPSGTYVAYATAAGQVAADGAGGNSPFTEALAESIQKPGLLLESVFKQTRAKVRAATNGEQIPFDSSAIEGDFYFIPAVATAPDVKVEDPALAPKADAVTTQRTLKVAADGSAEYATLTEAIAAANAGDRIEIWPGKYVGGIVVDKPLDIVGIGEPLLEANEAHVIDWQAPSGLISGLRIIQTHDSKNDDRRFSAVKFTDASARLENNILASTSDDTVVVIGANSDVVIHKNKIINSRFSGVLVSQKAVANIIENEIDSNGYAGIMARSEATATLTGNKLQNNDTGVVVAFGAKINGKANIIQNNANGVKVLSAIVDMRENQILNNKWHGVEVNKDGTGIFENNKITGNKGGAWLFEEDTGELKRKGNIE